MVKNPNYKEPSKEDIRRAIERCGYEYYLPERLLEDLIILSSYYTLNRPLERAFPKELLESTKEFNQKLIEFYRSLNFDNYPGNAPLEKAIFTLKELSRQIDFRSFEGGKVDFQKKVDNFKEELDEIDKVFFKESVGEIDHDALAQIVSLSMFLETCITFKTNADEREVVRGKLTRYSEYMKTARPNLVRPDFLVKLIKKSLPVTKELPKTYSNEILIYLEDATNSMTQNKGYLIAQAVRRLILKDNRVVHYYRFAGDLLVFKELKTYEEKLEIFTSPCKYYDRKNDYLRLIRTINSKYNKGNVILVTDGNDYVSSPETNLTYHFAGTTHNQDMKNFIKQTGGKYLLL